MPHSITDQVSSKKKIKALKDIENLKNNNKLDLREIYLTLYTCIIKHSFQVYMEYLPKLTIFWVTQSSKH